MCGSSLLKGVDLPMASASKRPVTYLHLFTLWILQTLGICFSPNSYVDAFQVFLRRNTVTEALLLAVSKSKPSKPTADVADMIPTEVDEPTDMAARVSTDDHQWPEEWSIEEEIAEEVDTEDTELDYDSVLYQQLFICLYEWY